MVWKKRLRLRRFNAFECPLNDRCHCFSFSGGFNQHAQVSAAHPHRSYCGSIANPLVASEIICIQRDRVRGCHSLSGNDDLSILNFTIRENDLHTPQWIVIIDLRQSLRGNLDERSQIITDNPQWRCRRTWEKVTQSSNSYDPRGVNSNRLIPEPTLTFLLRSFTEWPNNQTEDRQ